MHIAQLLGAKHLPCNTKGQQNRIGDSPPAIVFAAELEVAQHYGNLCACDDQDHKHQAKEAEEVVELVEPHGGQNEEELNEDSAKWQNASNQDAEHWVHVPWLFRYLSGDLIGAHGVLKCWGLVAKVGANKDQRH